MSQTPPEEHTEPFKTHRRNRPFICTVALSVALTYFLVLAFLFLSGLIFSGKIIDIITLYAHPQEKSPGMFLLFTLAGTLLFLTASAGILVFLLKKRWGFFLFVAAALVILGLDLIFLPFDWVRYLILSGFVSLLGIIYLTGRCIN